MSAGFFGLLFEENTKNKNHERDRNDTKGDVSLPLHEIKSPLGNPSERRTMTQGTRNLT